MRSLTVFWANQEVGQLVQTKTGAIHFAYSQIWIRGRKAPISLSMPVSDKPFHEEAKAFFGNLLPEGDFRRRIERLFKVSSDNDFSLLAEIGGKIREHSTFLNQLQSLSLFQ